MLGSLYFGQRRLIWVGQRANSFEAADPRNVPGVSLVRHPKGGHCACYVPAPPSAPNASTTTTPTIVYFHGNGDQAGWGGAFLAREMSRRHGLGFFAVEYPGYGLAAGPGSPSEAAVLEASEALLVHLEGALSVPRAAMVLVGQSIGCSPALQLAAKGW